MLLCCSNAQKRRIKFKKIMDEPNERVIQPGNKRSCIPVDEDISLQAHHGCSELPRATLIFQQPTTVQ
jgi:hypothetical protein